MILQQISRFEPTKHAYFPNSQQPCIEVHPNQQYTVFSTRGHELILHNKNTGRISNLFTSQHGIVDAQFTSDLILVIQKGYHQILCFSLKTQKLKKKISGNRSQILKLTYCRQRGIFAVITHDVCSIYNEHTLNRQKMLKCSTSSFTDCLINPSGQYMFTVFKDSTFFVWDLDEFTNEQYEVEGKQLKVACNYSSYVCLYNDSGVWIGDLSTQLLFQKVERFWSGDDSVVRVDFIENILIVQTENVLYLAEVQLKHKFLVDNIKAVEGNVTTFRVGGYGSMILLLSNSAKRISALQIVDDLRGVIGKAKNPLQNQGLHCCGGYSNQKGCVVSDGLDKQQIYTQQSHKCEPLNSNAYRESTTENFSVQKFQEFLLKHHIFPDKHRLSAYKFLLELNICPQQFRQVEHKGWHECVEFLDMQYPLENKKLSNIMKNVISWLAWIDPIYGEYEHMPAIVFPIVCLFGQDEYICFEITYRLMTNWMSFLFEEFPVPNSRFLQNVYEILDEIDPTLINHLKEHGITFTKVCWGLIGNMFTTNLPKEAFLAVLDNMVARPRNPEIILFILIGYLEYNRVKILNLKSSEDMDTFLSEEHTVSTSKFMKYVNTLYDKHCDKVIYKFTTIDFARREYLQMGHYPREAVKMYQGRRKLQNEEFRNRNEKDLYREKFAGEVEKMTTQIRRNSQREQIRAESFGYHVQNEEKNRQQLAERSMNTSHEKGQRIRRLKVLMEELQNAIRSEKDAKNSYKTGMSFSVSANLLDHSQRQLDELELKLMEQLTKYKPSSSNGARHMHSVPINSFHQRGSGSDNSMAFRSMVNAELANKLWDVDSLDQKSQEQHWENEMLRSMKQ